MSLDKTRQAVEYLWQEWHVVRGAPVVVITLILAAAVAGFLGGRLLYSERISVLDARIAALGTRLEIVRSANQYDAMTTNEVKGRLLDVVGRLNEFLRLRYSSRPSFDFSPEEVKDEARVNSRLGAYQQWMVSTAGEFATRFKTEAIMLRDAAMKRLANAPPCDERGNRALEWGLPHVIPDYVVANYLECVARSLPD